MKEKMNLRNVYCIRDYSGVYSFDVENDYFVYVGECEYSFTYNHDIEQEDDVEMHITNCVVFDKIKETESTIVRNKHISDIESLIYNDVIEYGSNK